MRSGQGSSPRWGLLATVAIHGLLWGGWKLSTWQLRAVDAPAAGPVLQVRLIAPPRPALSAALQAAPASGAPAPVPPGERDAIHYHFPEEVDRELLLRRDPTDELPIPLPRPVVLHLFVDAQGRVNAVTVEDRELAPALVMQLQEAFMQLLFLPAEKRGQAVAARIRIEVAAHEAAPIDQQPAGPIVPR